MFLFFFLLLFQSPRSGKFVSNESKLTQLVRENKFQSPRSGEFVSDYIDDDEFTDVVQTRPKFQSPRSGKFVSDVWH